jgi:hypothetical protein
MSLLKSPALCPIKDCYKYRDHGGHHMVRKGASGSNGQWNRIGLCRLHHSENHNIGDTAFVEKHSEIKKFYVRAKEYERVWYLYKNSKLKIEDMNKSEKEILIQIRKENIQ